MFGIESLTGPGIASSYTILNVNASIPILQGTGATLVKINSLFQGLAVAIKAFLVLSLIGSGITAVISGAGFLFGNKYRIIKYAFLVSLFSAVLQTVSTIVFGLVVVTISSIISKFGDDLDLYIDKGGFMALTSTAFVFDVIGTIYWTSVWFVGK